MEDHKPDWYAKARKGPFGNEKFTSRHADHVIRRIQEDGQQKKSRPGMRLRIQFLAAASIVVLIGLGLFVFEGKPSGDVTSEPTHAAVSTHITETVMKQTAMDFVQNTLGKSYPLNHREKLIKQKQMFFFYQEGEDSASIWINYETGELVEAKMSAIMSADEISSELKSRAEELKVRLGYADDSAYDVLRFVDYDAGKDTAPQIQNNFRAEKWRIGFLNDELEYASATMAASAVSEDARKAGDQALAVLGGSVDPELISAFRAIGDGQDTLTLNYGAETSVTLGSATRMVQQVSDKRLAVFENSNAGKLNELDRKLSNVDGDELREKAGPILKSLFGITNVKEYTLRKKEQEPGNLTFYKSGEPLMTVYYDSHLTIWKVSKESGI